MKLSICRRFGFIFLIVIGFSPVRAFADSPPLYEGELDLCGSLQRETSRGAALSEAVASFIRGHAVDDPDLNASIQRTIIHRAIQLCRYDPSVVVAAAYHAGIPLSIIVNAAAGAGVDRESITADLIQAGAAPSDVRAAFVRADTLLQPAVSVLLPPVFEAGNGLGPASPFLP